MQKITELIVKNASLKTVEELIKRTYFAMHECYTRGGKTLLAGNGGSAADTEHIVGELMKGFCKKRPLQNLLKEKLQNITDENLQQYYLQFLQHPLEAISLVSHSGLISAFNNDVDPDLVYAQQVLGYGKHGDVFIGISTSGNSKNILHATRIAKAIGMITVGLTGNSGGELKKISDICINVPAEETAAIQELHLPIYHALCQDIESAFFDE